MKKTRLAGELTLVRGQDEDDPLVVGDVLIGGVSLLAIWPATEWDSEVRVEWNGKAVCGEPGVVARYGDTLEEDRGEWIQGSHEWAILEIGGQDIVPQLALLEGEHVVLTVEYKRGWSHCPVPKDDYEEAAGRIGQRAACREVGYANAGPMRSGGPGRISTRRVEGMYSTGIFRWSGIECREGPNYEPRWEPFAEVRWADSEQHAGRLRDEWVKALVYQGRQARAEHENILRTKKRVAFQDAGGSPYIGVITSGSYGEKGLTVQWEWHWSPVPPLGNPVVDPGNIRLLGSNPTQEQLAALAAIAKKASDGVWEKTSKDAETKEFVRAAAWPFWTAPNLEEALKEVGLEPLSLPICYGTEPLDYMATT